MGIHEAVIEAENADSAPAMLWLAAFPGTGRAAAARPASARS